MEQNRLLSPVTLAAIAAQVLSILVLAGVIDTGVSEAIEAVVVAVLELLTTFGVLNNPTSKKTF
ncbi:MAG: holin [Clostridia bacterium]|nr:holin [Clostridia bacterium]MBQ8557147.1 holin [Clostridia bacterium]